jgi:hypothetical protein
MLFLTMIPFCRLAFALQSTHVVLQILTFVLVIFALAIGIRAAICIQYHTVTDNEWDV